MIKLLLLALLGLGLGGGVWKAQNPEGTLDDLKSQSSDTIARLKTGVDAVVKNSGNGEQTAATDAQSDAETLNARLESLEKMADEESSQAPDIDISALVDEKLAENANSLASLQATLNDRVAPMETMTAAVAELDTALQDTRARTDAGNVRLDTIERRLDLLVRRLDEQTTEETISNLSDSVLSQEEQLKRVRAELVAKQASIGENIQAVSEQTKNIDLRLGTLLSAANTGTENTVDTDALTALSANIDERLSELEGRLSTVNADSRRLVELSEQLESTTNKLTELEQNNSEAQEAINELDSSVQALATAGESLSIDAIQAQIKDQLAAVQLQIDTSSDTGSTLQLESLLETTRSRIQTLEQRVQDLPASSSEADDAAQAQSALQAQIGDLEQRLEQLSSADPALENAVNDVKLQVEQLSSKGFVTQDDLRAAEQSEAIEYKIYFDRNSTEISEDAAKVLNSFITQEKNRTTGVSIFGFTDRAGSAAYNQQLALQRATNVRSYLIQNGLDFTKVKALSGLGEDAAATVLPDDSADAQQRVVVLYAEQP